VSSAVGADHTPELDAEAVQFVVTECRAWVVGTKKRHGDRGCCVTCGGLLTGVAIQGRRESRLHRGQIRGTARLGPRSWVASDARGPPKAPPTARKPRSATAHGTTTSVAQVIFAEYVETVWLPPKQVENHPGPPTGPTSTSTPSHLRTFPPGGHQLWCTTRQTTDQQEGHPNRGVSQKQGSGRQAAIDTLTVVGIADRPDRGFDASLDEPRGDANGVYWCRDSVWKMTPTIASFPPWAATAISTAQVARSASWCSPGEPENASGAHVQHRVEVELALIGCDLVDDIRRARSELDQLALRPKLRRNRRNIGRATGFGTVLASRTKDSRRRRRWNEGCTSTGGTGGSTVITRACHRGAYTWSKTLSATTRRYSYGRR
jgi:hypothetical protein